MPLPSNAYYPMYPAQIQTIGSTDGLPLAAGTYSFYEDQNRTVPKDVYQRTENPDNTFTYASLGNVLTLSSIGTFVSAGGDNIIPFLWPFEGFPTDNPVSTTVQLYYIIVESSGSVEQFTVSAWPPEVSGGSSSANSVISSTNIISNPQFAVINYPSPYTFTVSGSSTIQIAPDWQIITSGSGTVTIGQVAVVDTAAPGLPAFALSISCTGVPVLLSQKIPMSPRILETGFAAGTFIVESNIGTPAVINMNYVPSDPVLTSITVCSTTATNGSYTAAYGTVNLASLTINPDSGLVGYVNVQLTIPENANVNVSCVQLISVAAIDASPTYIQDPTTRQIDHIYHDAYPIVPVGTVIDFAGFAAPLHYLLCDGTAYSRITYNQLFRALSLTQNITQVSTTTFTVTSASQLGLGFYIEGAGIPPGTYITVISGTTITVQQATTSTGTFAATFYAYGQGDGSLTFNVPDLTGQVIAGSGGNLVATTPLLDVLGQYGGAASTALSITNMPAHNHPGSTVAIFANSVNGAGSGASQVMYATGSTAVSVASQGSGTAFDIVQPTTILYKYIRFE